MHLPSPCGPDRQRDRIKRDPILSEGATIMGVPSTGGTQDNFVLRLDFLQAWLFGVVAATGSAETAIEAVRKAAPLDWPLELSESRLSLAMVRRLGLLQGEVRLL